MADAIDLTKHGFTLDQANALQKKFGRKAEQIFDRPTLMWLIGGLAALGVAVASLIWTEIGSLRDDLQSLRDDLQGEIDSVRGDLRAEIAANRAQIVELAKGQARIEAILEERLPRNR